MAMTITCCGANLFHQWNSEDLIMKEFVDIKDSGDPQITLPGITVRDINWSYNIVEYNKNFYMLGSWIENKSRVTKIPLPAEVKQTDAKNQSLIVLGNDFHIIVIHTKLHKMWFLDIEDMNKIKEVKLNIEIPTENVTKKFKIDDYLVKAVATNNTCLLITHNGIVYEGFLPSLVQTNHCTGNVIDIQCGFEHFVLLTDTGHVYTWGNGRRLQLGHGDLTNLETPTEVEALSGIKIVKVCAGGWHTLALSEHGDLYSWGWNDTGQLGIKTDNTSGSRRCTEVMKGYPIPTLVDFFDDNMEEIPLNVVDIACGSRHSCILLEDNSVWTSGNNKYGQLGCSNVLELKSFKKVYQCDINSKLLCGLWSSIIVKKEHQ